MNYQTIQVTFKRQTHVFNLQAIDNLQDLQTAIHLNFGQLPFNFQIKILQENGEDLTELKLFHIKQAKVQNLKLYIKTKDHDADILQLRKEISEINILDDSSDRCIEQRERQNMHQQIIFQSQKSELDRFKNKQMNSKLKQKQQCEILNQDIQCNGCFSFPIRGVIYKCLVCKDFDLCSKCQENKHYYHPLLKVVRKKEYPISLKVTFSKKSQQKMQKLEELDKINEERLKQIKYQKQVPDCRVVDPSQLKSRTVIAKNFLSQMIDSTKYS